MKRAVFLDRDGTLIYDRDHITDPDDVILMPGVGEQVKGINDRGWLAILVFNQSVIGRGWANFGDVWRCNDRLEEHLASFGARLDMILFCPHEPNGGCNCRKPGPGLLYMAAVKYDLDLRYCVMIGNEKTDMDAANAVGMPSIKVGPGGLAEWNANSLDGLDERLMYKWPM